MKSTPSSNRNKKMSKENTGATPAPAATPPAAGDPPKGQTPGEGGNPGNPQDPEDGFVKVPRREWKQTERDAGRYRALKAPGTPRAPRTPAAGTPPEPADPEVEGILRQKDETIGQLNSKVTQLEVKEAVRDLLESDEYKDLPASVKRLVRRNPFALVAQDATTKEHALEDIRDYLDEELDNADGGSPAAPANPTPATGEPKPGEQTPPAKGSGPGATPASNAKELPARGSARSVAILEGLLGKKENN